MHPNYLFNNCNICNKFIQPRSLSLQIRRWANYISLSYYTRWYIITQWSRCYSYLCARISSTIKYADFPKTAKEIFSDTKLNITNEGKRHVGGLGGIKEYRKKDKESKRMGKRIKVTVKICQILSTSCIHIRF